MMARLDRGNSAIICNIKLTHRNFTADNFFEFRSINIDGHYRLITTIGGPEINRTAIV